MKTAGMILFLVCSLTVFSQEYNPLLGESNEWYVIFCWEPCGTEIYTLGEDSLINSILYKPLKSHWGSEQVAFLREDSLKKKVYALTNPNTEIIYLDFSLHENDSIELTDLDNNYLGWYYVDSIRPINIIEGIRNAFYLSGKTPDGFDIYPVWVEGVGTLCSPEYPAYTSDSWNLGELTCAFRNGVKVYESALAIEYQTCEIYTDVPETETAHNFHIYPNPSSSSLYIETGEAVKPTCTYKIYSSSGIICDEGTIWGKKKELTLEQTGIYYIVISDKDKILETKKVLITSKYK